MRRPRYPRAYWASVTARHHPPSLATHARTADPSERQLHSIISNRVNRPTARTHAPAHHRITHTSPPATHVNHIPPAIRPSITSADTPPVTLPSQGTRHTSAIIH
ncbi:hypothetical protein JB92DRAFT_2912635 [Gautieria morchelliformis]|nr:hypothetical protein JB92DRAFT_2912635 [Gautieria morchelliformis]